MAMNLSKRQVIAERVVHFYQNFADYCKSKTWNHFKVEGEKKPTIYRIIKNFETTGTHVFRPKTGRKPSVSTPSVVKKVSKMVTNSNISEQEIANKLKISQKTVNRIKSKNDIKTRKCKTGPKYLKDQKRRAKTNSRKLYRKTIGKVLIIDDETYVTCDPKSTGGNRYYSYKDIDEVPEEVMF